MTGRSRFAAGGLGSRHTGRCQEAAHRAFTTLQRRRTYTAMSAGVSGILRAWLQSSAGWLWTSRAPQAASSWWRCLPWSRSLG